MKQLRCEMCGSADIVKQDGLFVCQACGMKYSQEEARKMMIEGTVDVQGTVKLDNTSFVEKFLANARRAKQKEDWEETEKYYNMVEQNEPTNIEAIFYSAYGKAKTTLIDSDIYKRQAAFNVLRNSVSVIDDNFNIEKRESEKDIIIQIVNDVIDMSGSSYVYNYKHDQYGKISWSDKTQTEILFNDLINELINTLFEIYKKFPEGIRGESIYILENMIKLRVHRLKRLPRDADRSLREKLIESTNQLYRMIKDIDPDYPIPESASPEKIQEKYKAKNRSLVMPILAFAFALVSQILVWALFEECFSVIGMPFVIACLIMGIGSVKRVRNSQSTYKIMSFVALPVSVLCFAVSFFASILSAAFN